MLDNLKRDLAELILLLAESDTAKRSGLLKAAIDVHAFVADKAGDAYTHGERVRFGNPRSLWDIRQECLKAEALSSDANPSGREVPPEPLPRTGP